METTDPATLLPSPELHAKVAELEEQLEWCLALFLPEDLLQSKNGTWRLEGPEGFIDAPDWLVAAIHERVEKARDE